MKHQLVNSALLLLFLPAAFALAVAVTVVAQQPMSPPADRTNTDRLQQQDMSKREYQLRNFGIEHNGPLDDKQKRALLAQVEQDFNRILFLHNEIVRTISTEMPLDNRFLSDAAAEIKKRSSRLQSTLALSVPADEKRPTEEFSKIDGNQFGPALLALCKHIKDFVTNPIIETPGTVNAQQLVRARNDLASIISLSTLIRKHAEHSK